jgi:DNA polymerase I-like protein with 3'-5' exonuclease and polymerase domains
MIKHEMENAFKIDVPLEVEIGHWEKLVGSALHFVEI